MALPANWYFEGEAFQHERKTLFATSWLMLGRASAFAQPGDYLSLNLAGWPVFGLRGEDGALRAFRNVCRHQQMQVVEKPTGHCDGRLRCRYHGWTYDTRGKLIEAPPLYPPEQPDSPNNNLVEIALASLHGLVMVNLERTASPPPTLDIRAAPAFTAEFTTDISCNWKVLAERIIEQAAFEWHWPTLALDRGTEDLIAHQIIPRTFSRTRVISHCFALPERIEATKTWLAAEKAACESLQAALQEGSGIANESPATADFHAAVRAAHERTPIIDALAKRA